MKPPVSPCFSRHAGALALALALAVTLPLAACDRSPKTPNPTTDAPTSGGPASTPATTSGGLSGGAMGSPTGTEQSRTGTDTLGGAGGTTATAAGSGTTGTAPGPSGNTTSPSGATGTVAGGTAATGESGGLGSDAAGTSPTGAPGTSTAGRDGSDATRTLGGGSEGSAAGGDSGSDRDAAGAMSGGTGSRSGTDATGAATSGQALTRAERSFLTAAAASGNFEVAMAQLATQRADREEIKRYAQMLTDHHSGANQELQALARDKGVSLPTDVPAARKSTVDRLSKARGADFERQFVQSVGMQAHREDIALFERASREARDPQLKAFADRTLPVLREHLDAARRLPGASGSAAEGSQDRGTRP